MPKVFNPTNIAQKWNTNFARSGPAYAAGVQGVQTAPGAAAAAAVQKYVNNVAANAAKFARKVGAVSNSAWQAACTNKGIPRFASGAAAGQAKVQSYMTQAAPVYQDIINTAASMPNDGSTESQTAIVAMAINKMKALSQSLT